jgi:hypothetical protein
MENLKPGLISKDTGGDATACPNFDVSDSLAAV